MPRRRKSRPAWQRRGSPIGRKGPRKAHPRYTRNRNASWSDRDLRQLRSLIRENTPTRVIGLQLGRSESSIRVKARREGLSLKPINRSPYTRRKKVAPSR
jgi:hypothetical protein